MNDISIADLAIAIGVSRQAVYNWLEDPKSDKFSIPRLDTMANIAKFTNNQVKPRDFFEDIETAVYNKIDEDIRFLFLE